MTATKILITNAAIAIAAGASVGLALAFFRVLR